MSVLPFRVSNFESLPSQPHREKMALFGLFASELAHDINNPLSGILAYVQLARENIVPGSQLAEDLEEIEKAALRCKKIVQQLTGLSRPVSNIEKSHLRLEEILKNVSPLVQVQWKGFPFQWHWEPFQTSPVWVEEVKLEQVFTNLLTNAFQAIRPGGHIRIGGGENSQEVWIDIHDDGEVIPAELQHRIFDPYFTTKPDRGGSGLGLSVSHQIIEEHHGRIEVKSSAGEGTLFRVVLPQGEKNEEAFVNH